MSELDDVLKRLEKAYGAGSVMRLGDDPKPVPVVSTGSIGLDHALGVGGLPLGRVVEIYGPESSGKSTLTLHVIANVQKMGGTAAYIDAEHAMDPGYARKLGVNTSELIVCQPSTAEEALQIADELIKSGQVKVVVIDSIAALVPRSELEGDMGDSNVGKMARLMSQAMRKMTPSLSQTGTLLLCVNQIREKIGVMFGSPETTTGGRALKYYSSVRLDTRKMETLKDDGDAMGNRTKVKIVKNKCAPPFREATFELVFGEGISKSAELADLGVEYGIIQKRGSWFSYGGQQLGQGRKAVVELIKSDGELSSELESKLRGLLK